MIKKESKTVSKVYVFKRNEFLQKLGITDISDVDDLFVSATDDYTIMVQGTNVTKVV